MIYIRRQYGDEEEVKCENEEDAFKKAMRDWATGEYLPLKFVDSDGKEVISHADLRKKLLKKTGLKEFRRDWR